MRVKKCEACDGKAVCKGLCAECYAEFSGIKIEPEPMKRKTVRKPKDDYRKKYAKLQESHKKLRFELIHHVGENRGVMV